MYILIIIFSSLSFVQDEPLFSISVERLEFRSKDRCILAQEWISKSTDANSKCFKK